MKSMRVLAMVAVLGLLAGCGQPEVGSKAWCEAMKQRPKSEWSLQEAADYASYCALGIKDPVGSKAWCERMDEKPKGDWTASEAASYAKHCVF